MRQRELTLRYRYALACYRALPWPCVIDERRFCDHVVTALGPIVWANSAAGTGPWSLSPEEAYRAARAEYDTGV